MTGSVRGEISVGDAETPAWAEDLGGRKSVERRLMPEGMIWPRFEDGEQVRLGDEVQAHNIGQTSHVTSIVFSELGSYVYYRWGGKDDGAGVPGNRVKRPAPKVLDADGVEIRVGDVLYSVESGDYVIVDSIEPGNPWFATTDSELQHCAKFTHQRPALDADGVPIKVGDTVYDGNGKQLMVREVIIDSDPDDPEHTVWCGEEVSHGFRVYRIADQLTHQLQDSWERIEATERGE